ncbi:hypothetical protein LFYK43_20150 [Ligilactobacillus salitolerans]|uniref:THIF-type NAD/FAD binding fold domain-containing protein n=1 Tax=Ligilactobacillus salitolerans TaxID=1808352 RepID=A0A401IVM3_9LACO|nr:ThiF family adenylyltransferase [Ligilactobacillus salitolerans]GBG95556.1 hypothetical protein LFYK43_20150 [Ligilactobacillus salitolerans]
MYLKKHLTFFGSNKKDVIYVRKPGITDEILEIEPENFETIWEYLSILSDKKSSSKSIEKWREKFNISKKKEDEFNSFLKENDLVYTSSPQKNENVRALNFFNNLTGGLDRYKVEKKIQVSCAVIIGVGTIGTALVRNLLQFDVKSFILIDNDIVTSKNLKHQSFFIASDVGKPKVQVLKDRILEIDPSVSVLALQSFFTSINEITNNAFINSAKYIDIFCCFDHTAPNLLTDLVILGRKEKFNIYITSYKTGSVDACILNENYVKALSNDIKEYPYSISENSGIGLLGEVSSHLLMRLWLQNFIETTDFGWDSLGYDFITFKPERIPAYFKKNTKFPSSDDEFVNKFSIEPYFYDRAFDYYITNNSSVLYELQAIADRYHIPVDLSEEDEETVYLEMLQGYKFHFNDFSGNVLSFANLFRNGTVISEQAQVAFSNQLRLLEPYVIKLLESKKRKYYKRYLYQWRKNEKYRKGLVATDKAFLDILFKKTMDFAKWQPVLSILPEMTLSDQIQNISLIDEKINSFDVSRYLEFLFEHNLIEISKNNKRSMFYYNGRYKYPRLSIQFDSTIDGQMAFAHEVGHGYFISLISSSKLIEGLPEEISELFSSILEFLVLFNLNDKNSVDLNQTIAHYLYRSIDIPFTIDEYEKEILQIPFGKINWNTIKNARRKALQENDADAKFSNEKLSDYNIALNTELLIQERSVYLYSKSHILGFEAAYLLTKNNELFKKMVVYLANKREKFSLEQIYEEVFNIQINESSFFKITNHFKEYLQFLLK